MDRHLERPLPPPSGSLDRRSTYRTARAAALYSCSMAPRLRSAVVRFDALPEEALRVIMLALPVDARGRAACVCRGWRAFLAEPSLWQVLDLTPAGGVAAGRLTENLVRGAVVRAAGQLRTISLNHVYPHPVHTLLVASIVSDGAELQQVSTDAFLRVADLKAVFAAAPRLQVLNANLHGRCAELLPILRNHPPYGPLRVRHLDIRDEEADFAFGAAVAGHESLKVMTLSSVARGLNTLVNAAADRRISCLTVLRCVMDAETIPALARLLQRGSLTKLDVNCLGFPLAQDESLPVLCAALRSCGTLKHLTLVLCPPEGATRHAVTELLDAAAALPALSVLNLNDSVLQDKADAGRALGALLRANLPSLRTLNVERCYLFDESMAELLDGLAANTHLRELNCRSYNNPSEAFERDRLRPALEALAARAQLDA